MDYDGLLSLSTEVGYFLMKSGAEIYRVEESILRILGAYGISTGEVFAIPNCIIVSISTPEGHALSRVRRIPNHGTDIDLLERYNDLSRHLCQEAPPLDEAQRWLETVGKEWRFYSFPGLLVGHFLGASVFCLFFGGTLRDALASGLCGLAICLVLTFMTRLGTNPFFKTIAGGAASALLALGLCWCGLGQNSDLIIIGALMLLVPGIIFTNAIRDIMAGDMMAGISKSAEAILLGAAMALGTGSALWLARLLWR